MFRSHFTSFLPLLHIFMKVTGINNLHFQKGTTLLFSDCVPSLIYIYEAKYEPWGGIPIVSPHFVTLKDLFKGNVLYFCGNIVSPAQTQWEHSCKNMQTLSVLFFRLLCLFIICARAIPAFYTVKRLIY